MMMKSTKSSQYTSLRLLTALGEMGFLTEYEQEITILLNRGQAISAERKTLIFKKLDFLPAHCALRKSSLRVLRTLQIGVIRKSSLWALSALWKWEKKMTFIDCLNNSSCNPRGWKQLENWVKWPKMPLFYFGIYFIQTLLFSGPGGADWGWACS